MKVFIINMLFMLLAGHFPGQAQSVAMLSASPARTIESKETTAPQATPSLMPAAGGQANVTVYSGLIAGSDIRLHVADISGDISVQVANFQGRVLVGRRYKAGAYGHDISLPATYLNAGIYYLNVACNGVKKVQTIELTEE